MNAIQMCQQVADQHQYLFFREKKTSEKGKRDYEISYESGIYEDITEDMENLAMRDDTVMKKGKGWTTLDAVTANAVMTVYKALKDHQQTKIKTLDIFSIINFTWKCVK